MEHSISPRLEAKMLEMIGEVHTCPHGHPIGDYPREPGEPLPAVPVGSEIVVLRLENEAEEVLHYMKQHGVEPGVSYTRDRARGATASEAETDLEREDGELSWSPTSSPAPSRCGSTSAATGPSPSLAASAAELQLMGESRWGM